MCLSRGCVQLFATPQTVPLQASLSIEFSRLEHWSGQPFPSAWDLPDPGIKLVSPILQVNALLSELPGKSQCHKAKHLFSHLQCLHIGWESSAPPVPFWVPGKRQGVTSWGHALLGNDRRTRGQAQLYKHISSLCLGHT